MLGGTVGPSVGGGSLMVTYVYLVSTKANHFVWLFAPFCFMKPQDQSCETGATFKKSGNRSTWG